LFRGLGSGLSEAPRSIGTQRLNCYHIAGKIHVTRNFVTNLIIVAAVVFSSLTWADDWAVVAEPDQSDWSTKRIVNYEKYNDPGEPQAVIRVPDRNIEAAVYPDSMYASLEVGVAWVSSTAAPGSQGNVVIAGHRDSFFRRLEGIPAGTRVYLRTQATEQVFTVETVSIVDALDVSSLEQTPEDVLTLVTCHPFYYRGYAPDRYIVRAKRVDESGS
jgi:LPXTG-site transpeptidase (sortase) family protein